MSRHTTSESSNAVGLFPFLAVLLCTMGALLVLLVVMAQNVGKKPESVLPVVEAPPQGESVPTPPGNETIVQAVEETPSDDPSEAIELAQYLEELSGELEQLEELEEKTTKTLDREKDRLAHLEAHARRIQHELAELSIAAQQLELMENSSSVDNERAEKHLVHLKELIEEKEKQLEDLRADGGGQKAYAIVPYKGPNGTYRRPIYIECSKENIILHPEGVELQESDFLISNWAGNPLAAALRASREYLNAKAAREGQDEPPDPYALILIRPDGIAQYVKVRSAILSWDADYGYEFIDSDWKLEFPELPDPLLAEAQNHAVMMARERLVRRIRSAPSRFRGIGRGSIAGGGGGRSDRTDRYGSPGFGGFATQGQGDSLTSSGAGTGNSTAANGTEVADSDFASRGQTAGPEGNFLGGGQYSSEGLYSSTTSAGNEASHSEYSNSNTPGAGQSPGGEIPEQGEFSGQGGDSYDRYASSGNPNANGEQANQQNPGSRSDSASGSQGSGLTASSSQSSQSQSDGGAPSLNFSMGQSKSIAESRGKDWAIREHSIGNVPIRRTIQVVVRRDRLAILPSRHASNGWGAEGVEIALNKSNQEIGEELAQALKARVKEWGYAGSGLYWRPVLEVNMGPDSQHTIAQFKRLLKDSGVELRIPEIARKGVNHARY